MLQKFRLRFDSLPARVKIIIYSGCSSFIATIISQINNGVFDWRALAIIPLTVVLNLIGYELINLKG